MIKTFGFHAGTKFNHIQVRLSASLTLSENRDYQSMLKTLVSHAYECTKFKQSIQLILRAPLT